MPESGAAPPPAFTDDLLSPWPRQPVCGQQHDPGPLRQPASSWFGGFRRLLSVDAARKRIAAMMSGLDIRYDFGEGHPLLGRRMPDLDLVTSDGTMRLFALLNRAKPLLLNFDGAHRHDIAPWADRVELIDAEYNGPWELPVIGAVTAPAAVLIRPDGYVAWVGEGAQAGLADTLTAWFGLPAP